MCKSKPISIYIYIYTWAYQQYRFSEKLAIREMLFDKFVTIRLRQVNSTPERNLRHLVKELYDNAYCFNLITWIQLIKMIRGGGGVEPQNPPNTALPIYTLLPFLNNIHIFQLCTKFLFKNTNFFLKVWNIKYLLVIVLW